MAPHGRDLPRRDRVLSPDRVEEGRPRRQEVHLRGASPFPFSMALPLLSRRELTRARESALKPQLFDTASVVEYYESFAKHAFESTATSITMQCVVLAPDGRPVPCAFCFSVRRDLFSVRCSSLLPFRGSADDPRLTEVARPPPHPPCARSAPSSSSGRSSPSSCEPRMIGGQTGKGPVCRLVLASVGVAMENGRGVCNGLVRLYRAA